MPNLRLSYLVAISLGSLGLNSIEMSPAVARESLAKPLLGTRIVNISTAQTGLDLGLEDSLMTLTGTRVAVNQSGLDIGLEDSLMTLIGTTVAVNPAPTSTPNSKQNLGLGVTARVGTLGLGVDVAKSFSPQFSGRLGFNFGNVNTNRTESGVSYDAKLNLSSVQLLGDYHPFGGGFRITGGLLAQNNKFAVTGKPDGNGSYAIDNTTYTAAQVGNLTGEYQYGNSIAPYLGIGFGQPANEGFGFNADLGVMFTGSPKVNLTANNPTFNNNSTTRTALDRQERQTENDLKGFNVYPVLSVGVSYGF
jgi:hypothetical protein